MLKFSLDLKITTNLFSLFSHVIIVSVALFHWTMYVKLDTNVMLLEATQGPCLPNYQQYTKSAVNIVNKSYNETFINIVLCKSFPCA
jgi:hypothetical protein